MGIDFNTEISLENSRVLICPLLISDFTNLIGVATEYELLLQYSPAPIHSEQLLKQYIKNALNERQNKTRYPFIVFDKHQNKFAGSSSFLNISNKDKRLEIGATWLGREFQKTGLNRNCKFLLLSYVFDTLEFECVEFRTDERNNASRAAIEKIGGKFEGMLRSHTLMSDGFRRNTVCYSILKNEWAELKKNFL